ncbi:MAG TPA: hypothetical protein VN886_12920 [Acidimicrobiales bacterium]|nr:hypothetical protein [Acidimicrobiales bacterium]
MKVEKVVFATQNPVPRRALPRSERWWLSERKPGDRAGGIRWCSLRHCGQDDDTMVVVGAHHRRVAMKLRTAPGAQDSRQLSEDKNE